MKFLALFITAILAAFAQVFAPRLRFRAVGDLYGGVTNIGPTPTIVDITSQTKRVKDASTSTLRALPAAASATVYSDPIDLGSESYKSGDMYDVEFVIPDLTATILPNTKTATFTVVAGSTTVGSSGAAIGTTVTLTGAGGVGATGGTYHMRVPADCARYIFLKIVFGADTTDGSALSAGFALTY